MGKPIKFNEIEIKSFRGIKDYTLKHDGNSMVFCGANGTGKSSFVNAYEFLFTGQIESLKGIGEVKHDKSLIHIGDTKKDVLVQAKINNHIIKRTLKDGLEYDEELEDLVNDFKNGSFILNRKKLLNFIDSKPSERWKETTKLIDFDKYDETEKILDKTFKDYKKQLKIKNEELDSNKISIQEYFEGEIDEVYVKVNKILKENNYESISFETDFDDYLAKNYVENVDLDDLNIFNINEKYQSQLNIFDEISLNQFKTTSSLLTLLNTSFNYISQENPKKCPICKSDIDSSEILENLQNESEKIKSDNAKLSNWQSENKKLIKSVEELNNKLVKYDLSDFITSLKQLTNLEITTSNMDREILASIQKELSNANKNTKDVEKAFKTILLLSKRKDIEVKTETVQKYYDTSKIILETFSQMKKEAIENIFNELGHIIDEYYMFIHEDDDITSPKVGVKSSKGLTLTLLFGDDESDPRSFASEGHIDTLGLCIFLAFVTKFNKHNFIVLDDIISTVDLEHKERIIRLLIEKFKDYCFIITTHNKLWFEQLKRLTRSYNVANDFTFIDIKGWDKDEGPLMSRNDSIHKKIIRYITEDDAEAAGNAIRRHLEYVLGEICKINGIKLPIKPRYTVNDYYEPCINHFKKIIKKTNVENYYHSIFAELDNVLYIGNLLSHENEEHYDLQMNEITRFRDAVYAFEDAFKCIEHNRFLRFDKERKIAMCSQKKCQNILIMKKLS